MVCYSRDEDIENDKYPYSCILCDCKARQKTSLNKHEEAIHVLVCYSCDEDIETNKYPYSCSHCDCKARQKSSLKKHVEAIPVLVCCSCDEDIETNKYTYSCILCDCNARQKVLINMKRLSMYWFVTQAMQTLRPPPYKTVYSLVGQARKNKCLV